MGDIKYFANLKFVFKCALGLIILGMNISCAKKSSPSVSYGQDIKLGSELIDEGRYDDAIAYFRGILENYRGENLHGYTGEELHQGIATAYAGKAGLRSFNYIDQIDWKQIEGQSDRIAKQMAEAKQPTSTKPAGEANEKKTDLESEYSQSEIISHIRVLNERLAQFDEATKVIPELPLDEDVEKNLTEAIAWLDVAKSAVSKRLQSAIELARSKFRKSRVKNLAQQAGNPCQWLKVGELEFLSLSDLLSGKMNYSLSRQGQDSQGQQKITGPSSLEKIVSDNEVFVGQFSKLDSECLK